MINDLIHGETWLGSEAKDIDAISEIEYRNLWRVYEAIKDHRNAFAIRQPRRKRECILKQK